MLRNLAGTGVPLGALAGAIARFATDTGDDRLLKAVAAHRDGPAERDERPPLSAKARVGRLLRTRSNPRVGAAVGAETDPIVLAEVAATRHASLTVLSEVATRARDNPAIAKALAANTTAPSPVRQAGLVALAATRSPLLARTFAAFVEQSPEIHRTLARGRNPELARLVIRSDALNGTAVDAAARLLVVEAAKLLIEGWTGRHPGHAHDLLPPLVLADAVCVAAHPRVLADTLALCSTALETLRPHLADIPDGLDALEATLRLCRRRGRGMRAGLEESDVSTLSDGALAGVLTDPSTPASTLADGLAVLAGRLTSSAAIANTTRVEALALAVLDSHPDEPAVWAVYAAYFPQHLIPEGIVARRVAADAAFAARVVSALIDATVDIGTAKALRRLAGVLAPLPESTAASLWRFAVTAKDKRLLTELAARVDMPVTADDPALRTGEVKVAWLKSPRRTAAEWSAALSGETKPLVFAAITAAPDAPAAAAAATLAAATAHPELITVQVLTDIALHPAATTAVRDAAIVALASAQRPILYPAWDTATDGLGNVADTAPYLHALLARAVLPQVVRCVAWSVHLGRAELGEVARRGVVEATVAGVSGREVLEVGNAAAGIAAHPDCPSDVRDACAAALGRLVPETLHRRELREHLASVRRSPGSLAASVLEARGATDPDVLIGIAKRVSKAGRHRRHLAIAVAANEHSTSEAVATAVAAAPETIATVLAVRPNDAFVWASAVAAWARAVTVEARAASPYTATTPDRGVLGDKRLVDRLRAEPKFGAAVIGSLAVSFRQPAALAALVAAIGVTPEVVAALPCSIYAKGIPAGAAWHLRDLLAASDERTWPLAASLSDTLNTGLANLLDAPEPPCANNQAGPGRVID